MDNIFENRAAFGRSIPAWHQKGKVLEGLMTFEQAIAEAELDYPVTKERTRILLPGEAGVGPDGEIVEAQDRLITTPGFFNTVAHWKDREPTILGAVGERYTVLQNRDAFGFFDSVIQDGEAAFDSAGALGRGERIWVLAMLPDGTFTVGDSQDLTNTYLLFTNSHDGSSSVEVALTPVRVVCQNTLTMALQGTKTRIKIRHTKSMEEKLEEATRVMGLARAGISAAQDLFSAMAKHKLTQEQRSRFITDVLGIDTESKLTTRSENILAKVGELLQGDPLADPDTLWEAYNAITAYADHARVVRRTDKGNGTSDLATRWFGSAAKMKEKAMVTAAAVLA